MFIMSNKIYSSVELNTLTTTSLLSYRKQSHIHSLKFVTLHNYCLMLKFSSNK